ncbi:ABC transporter ATP-binding protein, partial [Vibrio anguillarum]|nr:ABC transporter ATP-binding protein [Vibrio anguillarum]
SELSRLYNVRLRRLMVQTGEHFQSTICPVFGIREPDQDMPISYPLNKGKYNE